MLSGMGNACLRSNSKQATQAARSNKTVARMTLPKLIAFDLDATLWYPEVDMLYGPPFRLSHKGVLDKRGTAIDLMGDSRKILNRLATDNMWEGVQIAYVSRTELPEDAVACLKLFQVAEGRSMYDLAQHHEIFPGRKITHFQNIHQRSEIPYEDMLFFDNERRNIVDCKALGITCIHTPLGMTEEAWQMGLQAHAERHASLANGYNH